MQKVGSSDKILYHIQGGHIIMAGSGAEAVYGRISETAGGPVEILESGSYLSTGIGSDFVIQAQRRISRS